MTYYEYIRNNMDKILSVANKELASYGLNNITLYGITLTNCMSNTYDASFSFGATSAPSKDNRRLAVKLARSVLEDFINQYIPGRYTMNKCNDQFWY